MRLVDDASQAEIRALQHLTRCKPLDSTSLEQLGQLIPAAAIVQFEIDAERSRVIMRGVPHGLGGSFQQAFWSAFWSCEPCAYPDVTADRDSVTKLSDFYTPTQLKRTAIYRLFEQLLDFDDAMTVVLPSQVGTEARIMVFRHGRDFEERDRLTLALLRPHLLTAYQRAVERRHFAGALTTRQREILHLVARGFSNDQIADRLVLSPGTVRKHLENVFRQLNVSSRAAAVARAFPTGVPPARSDRHVPLPRQRS
jgi:DNA-binding CsgD family transcriptional regulator